MASPPHADTADTRRLLLPHTELTEHTDYLRQKNIRTYLFLTQRRRGRELYILLFFCLKLRRRKRAERVKFCVFRAFCVKQNSLRETRKYVLMFLCQKNICVSPLCGRHSGRIILENTNFTNDTNHLRDMSLLIASE